MVALRLALSYRHAVKWVGLGAMRLSEVDPQRADATLQAALAAGVTLVDTADVYGVSDEDRHGNEAWVSTRVGTTTMVATKGGLIRGSGRWRPDGRAKALRAACQGSREALGRDPIDLYQLHAPDPKTSLATSARALARLVTDGWVRRVGLCNVGVDQVRQVEQHVEISTVQVALSPFDVTAIRSGVIEYCRDRGVRVLVHSPFGGPQRAARIVRDDVFQRVGARHGLGPYGAVLAWLYDFGLVPLPGPTRPEHAEVIGRAAQVALTDDDRRLLDERIAVGAWLRSPRIQRRPAPQPEREVAIVMGIPAAGKTTAVSDFVERGYTRFNRDDAGGTLAKLHRRLAAYLADGGGRAVLDNTYATRAIRHEVIEAAWAHGRSLRCVWIDTSLEAAQMNAVRRLWSLYGRLPEPDEIRRASKREPNVFGPDVLTRFRDLLEPPHEEEGFSTVERRPFVAQPWPPGVAGTLIAEGSLDAAVRAGLVEQRPGPIGVIAWWPSLDVNERETRRSDLSSVSGRVATVFVCTHAATERCWCLMPLPGLGYAAVRTLGLDPTRSLWVGPNATHQRAAERFAMPFAQLP